MYLQNKDSIMRKKKLVSGVGLNDADYKTQEFHVVEGVKRLKWICPFYLTWRSMLARAHSEHYKSRHKSYLGVSVCDEWLTFSNFKSWMEKQDWEGKALDKDLLVRGNKKYSPDTCIFLTSRINSFICESHSKRGKFKLGVSQDNRTKRFIARSRSGSGSSQEHIGSFLTEEEAHAAWLSRKRELAMELAEAEENHVVAKALRERYIKPFD